MKLKLVGTGAIIGKERSACSLVDEKILIDTCWLLFGFAIFYLNKKHLWISKKDKNMLPKRNFYNKKEEQSKLVLLF